MRSLLKKVACIMLCAIVAISCVTSTTISSEAKAKKAKAKKNVVVVLDAGHDTTHLGCHYENFEEGTANLYIAYYCLQELQKYQGIDVYMSRTTFECPYGADPNSAAKCLASRVKFAKDKKADMLVSLHNDYDPDLDVTQNGCKVIVPNANYRPDICLKGVGMAQSILAELTTTGLTINNWKLNPNPTGIVTRDATSAKYPDGTPKDYYALINQSKSAGFTTVIVEHAFCTNKSDRENHLSTVEQYQELGIADATGIAKYYGLKLKK